MTIRTTKKVLFFIVGSAPTVDEQSRIDWLKDQNVPKYTYGVRTLLANTEYGDSANDSDTLEDCDYCADVTDAAGTNIPDAYSGVPVMTVPNFTEGGPTKLVIGPASLSFLHTALSQMTAFIEDADGNLTDVTNNAALGWTSATGATATIGAGTGKLTGVGIGTTVITATYTYDTSKTVTATETVTCT